MNPFQFVFPKPIICDKMKLELIEVTKDSVTTNMTSTPISRGITFLQPSTKYYQYKYSINKHDNKTHELKTKTISSDKLGDYVTYEFDSTTGVLTITGNGTTYNYSFSSSPLKNFEILTVSISNGVTSIGNYAFRDCSRLTSITIPGSVTSIGDHAFSCSSLTSITIPNSVTSIGEDAFSSCNSLESIEVDQQNNNFKTIDGILFSKMVLFC